MPNVPPNKPSHTTHSDTPPSESTICEKTLQDNDLKHLYPNKPIPSNMNKKTKDNNNHSNDTHSPLTIIIVSNNHGHCIERALASIEPLQAPLIVLDTGSKDNSITIAKKYTSHILFHPSQDTAWVIQKTLHQVKTPWVLWLYGDEWLPPNLMEDIQTKIKKNDSNSSPEGYQLTREPRWKNHPMQFGGHTTHNLRLFQPSTITIPQTATHTQPVTLHPNKHFTPKQIPTTLPAEPYNSVHQLLNNPCPHSNFTKATTSCHPSVGQAFLISSYTFIKHYILKFGWLDGPAGLLWAWAKAHHTMTNLIQDQ